MEKQYAERNAFELDMLGGYYARHVNAMTSENLHGKSDIAAELAFRDAEIEMLKMRFKEVDLLFCQLLTTARAAIIESKKGQENSGSLAIDWIYNYLEPRDELPPEDAEDAQEYFDKENEKIESGLGECYRFFRDVFDARKAVGKK